MTEFQKGIENLTGSRKTKGPDAIPDAKNKAAVTEKVAAAKPASTPEGTFKVFCMVDKPVVFNSEVKFEPYKWYEIRHPLHVRAARNQARRYGAGIVITPEGMAKPPGA